MLILSKLQCNSHKPLDIIQIKTHRTYYNDSQILRFAQVACNTVFTFSQVCMGRFTENFGLDDGQHHMKKKTKKKQKTTNKTKQKKNL